MPTLRVQVPGVENWVEVQTDIPLETEELVCRRGAAEVLLHNDAWNEALAQDRNLDVTDTNQFVLERRGEEVTGEPGGSILLRPAVKFG